jgi:hypothetical protein
VGMPTTPSQISRWSATTPLSAFWVSYIEQKNAKTIHPCNWHRLEYFDEISEDAEQARRVGEWMDECNSLL